MHTTPEWSPDRVVIEGKTFWRASGGRLIPAVEGGAVDTLDDPKTLEDFEAAFDHEKQAAAEIADGAKAAGRDLTDEERSKALEHAGRAKGFKERADHLRGEKELVEWIHQIGKKTEPATAPATTNPRMTIGEKFAAAENVQEYLKSVRSAPQSSPVGHSPALEFKGLKELGRKNVVTGGDHSGSAGALFFPEFLGLVDEGLFKRPLVVADLVSHGTTQTDIIEFAKEHSWTNNAAFVPEASGTSAGTASGDVAGKKPESAFTFEVDTARVVALAHLIVATRRALADATQLASYIDSFLQYGLQFKIDDGLLNGDGTGENFTGVLHTSGIQSVDHTTSGVDDYFSAVRRAIRLVQVNAQATPTAILCDPATDEALDLAQTSFGQFIGNGPTQMGPKTMWGLPRIVSQAMPASTMVVADWKRAMLWDREQATVLTSDSHADFFVRNLIAVLAELRAAFTVFRPSAFVKVDVSGITKVLNIPA